MATIRMEKKFPRAKLAIIGAAIIAIVAIAGSGYGLWVKKSETKPVTNPVAATSPLPITQPVISSEGWVDHAKTVAGEIAVTEIKGTDGFDTKALSLAGHVVYDQADYMLSIEKTFDFSGKTVVLLSMSSGGNLCPAYYRFLTVQTGGNVSFTDEFGTCSNSHEISVMQEEITITLPDMRGRGDEAWKYSNNGLSKIKHLDLNVERNAARLTFEEDQPIAVRGTLVRIPGGNSWALKLPSKTLLNGGAGSFCSSVMDTLPIDTKASPPIVQGETEFEVTIACPHAGAFISNIALPDSTGKQLQGMWSCATNRNNSLSQISFGAGGALEWIDDPGKITESHRIGTYRLTKQAIDININRIPEMAKLQRSPNVSISEGAQIKSLNSSALQFSWWQNSDPNDRVAFTCKKK